MLELKNIKKIYKTSSQEVVALNDVSISFKQNEFVSILGESGCGKTTLLNIIGGLDRYTDGDLIIDGVSTKQFSSKDWDAYRNYKIGFIFQSYNLISHLSVVENVEIALTLNGTSKAERRKKAIESLKKVGLEGQIDKKPNQLSGGQMQRVAIARALVNDPEIILADEPTGALDSKTSVQIMDLIKQISAEKLVIMVTHNPKLAKEYSTRIISLVDGTVESDEKSNQNKKKTKKQNNQSGKNKTSMNFFTAIYLSFKNLLSKKGRTIMTSFAGSIGIIGIALVLAISNGLNAYLGGTQNQTLASSPLTIATGTIDYDAIEYGMTTGGSSDEVVVDENSITPYESGSNLMRFRKYGHFNYLGGEFATKIAEFNSQHQDYFKSIAYTYYLPMRFVSYNTTKNQYVYSQNENKINIMSGDSTSIFFANNLKSDFVYEEYENVKLSSDYGNFEDASQKKFELTLVIDKNNRLDIEVLKSIGYAEDELRNADEFYPVSLQSVFDKEYKLLTNNLYYIYNGGTSFSAVDITDQSVLENKYQDATIPTFKVTRILRQKTDSSNKILTSGLMYSLDFENWYRQDCKESLISQKQQELHNQEVEAESTNYTFCDNFVFAVSGFEMMTPAYFPNTQAILSYLVYVNAEITNADAYNIAIQQIGISDVPQSIKYFPASFEAKDVLENFVKNYNKTTTKGYQIMVTDSATFLTEMLQQLINIISKVLVAFASISLVVSSIMIGIITYVSVIERTKEIGVLRSLGARKKDISRVFNAEAMIIGFVSGLIGITITYILSFVINIFVGKSLGVATLASLNPLSALALVAISIALTFISGTIPSKIASNRDPVECLRSE